MYAVVLYTIVLMEKEHQVKHEHNSQAKIPFIILLLQRYFSTNVSFSVSKINRNPFLMVLFYNNFLLFYFFIFLQFIKMLWNDLLKYFLQIRTEISFSKSQRIKIIKTKCFCTYLQNCLCFYNFHLQSLIIVSLDKLTIMIWKLWNFS